MTFRQGQHVLATSDRYEVLATVLEVRGEKLLVQELGTERKEEALGADCRPK